MPTRRRQRRRPSQPQAPAQLPAAQPPAARLNREFTEAAEAAAKFLSTPEGPRIGVLSYNGWDTHANEGPIKGQLALRLGGLDAAIRALESGMGPAWKDTIVADRHRVRPHRARQRHPGHRPRHGDGGAAGGRRREGRPHSRGLAGLARSCPLRGPRSRRRRAICAPCSRACCATTWAFPTARLGLASSPTAPRQRRSTASSPEIKEKRRTLSHPPSYHTAAWSASGYLPSTSTATRATPCAVMPMTPAAALDRSMMRPAI